MSETFQLLRVENAIIAAGIKHLVLHHPAHIGRLVWCRVLQASKQDAREYDRLEISRTGGKPLSGRVDKAQKIHPDGFSAKLPKE